MASMFDGNGFFWGPSRPKAQIGEGGVVTGVVPVGGAPGGFPGIYPGMGPSQAGGAGLLEFLARQEECVKSGKCPVTWGPSAAWW